MASTTFAAPATSGSSQARADALLAALDDDQRQVATTTSGPVCVIAGAGTGKTRAITHRIAYGVHSGIYVPQQVLAVTYTARAAGEMRTRLRELGAPGVPARTFHAAALRQVSFFWPQVMGGAPPQVLEHKSRLVAQAAHRLRLRLDRAAVRDVAAEIEWAKVHLLTAESYVAAATAANRAGVGEFDASVLARIMAGYEEVKTDQGMIDFEDVLLLAAGLIETEGGVADAVHRQYRHLVVDEYQDANALQQRLLQAWLGNRDDVCVVGDPRQTIYTFSGADATLLTGFRERYPQATVVRLVRDYRSTPQVVALANALVPRTQSATTGVDLVAQCPEGPRPQLRVYDDDEAEAAAVACAVKQLIDQGTRAREIAVIYRTNSQSQPLEQALSDVGVPTLVRGGERFFSRPEVREAMVLLRGAARAAYDGTDAAGGVDSGGEALTLADQVGAVLTSVGWSPNPPSGTGAVRERWESLQALVVLAATLAHTQPGAGLGHLVSELSERAAAAHAPDLEGVTLSSLHAAKGLEWDAVFIVGLSEGLMPISLAEGWQAVEEERRLLYVGVTRAREHLVLSWTRSRTPGGRGNRKVSRFLDTGPVTQVIDLTGSGLTVAGSASSAANGRGRGAARGRASTRSGTVASRVCSSCGGELTTAAQRKVRRCSSCPAAYDEAVFERLRQWRAIAAQEAKIPAYCVFTDATLAAIAQAVPTSTQALVQLPGIGAVKADKYGTQVLGILQEQT